MQARKTAHLQLPVGGGGCGGGPSDRPGQVEKLFYVIDATKIINPLIFDGHIHGGVIQGLGFSLTEHLLTEDGRITALSLGDYKLPTIRDVPPLSTAIVKANEGPGPFGAKAVGEAGISLIAPAIANAVADATGIRIKEAPITAEKIFTPGGNDPEGCTSKCEARNPKLETTSGSEKTQCSKHASFGLASWIFLFRILTLFRIIGIRISNLRNKSHASRLSRRGGPKVKPAKAQLDRGKPR